MKQIPRDILIREIKSRIIQRINDDSKEKLDLIINDVIYNEKERLKKTSLTRDNKKGYAYWRWINKRFINASENDKILIVEEIISKYLAEIIGNFNPRVYHVATKVLPIGLSLLLNALTPKTIFKSFPKFPGLVKTLTIQGAVSKIQRLSKIGTIVLTPTHLSNMDSVIVGYTLYRIGLPPFSYGAGLNLFTNPVISYFMNNLGAYKIDRKKTNTLYKDILKEYSIYTIEMGRHSLFFPGGTRNRTGKIEEKLKMGLLGTGLNAYINHLKNGNMNKKIYVVPCAISYHLVMEAETLIADALRQDGKSRYIIEDDESSRFRKWYDFFTKILMFNCSIYIRFSEPLDVFGNNVDDNGMSIDGHGRCIDPSRYAITKGRIMHDEERDSEYTIDLSEKIIQGFRRDTVILSTNFLAFALLELLARRINERDIYKILRTGNNQKYFQYSTILDFSSKLLEVLHKKNIDSKLCLSSTLMTNNLQEIVEEGIKNLSIYHTKSAVQRRHQGLYLNDLNLLFYYSNRLSGHDLEKEI